MSFALKPINPKIQKELARRAKALSRDSSASSGVPGSQNNISNELQTLNSRTTWMRWISGDDKPAVILGGLALTDAGETLYRLAKGFKEVYVPPNTPTVNVNRYAHQTADGSGTSSILYKPVAGVKSVTTGFEGSTKSVKKITVEWTVFDLDELEVLTPHFLWPGKWCMLEMGWNFKGMIPHGFYGTNLLGVLHDGQDLTNKYNSLEDQIYANNGNYECVTGVISNFEYTLRADGGFDCTTTLTTHGISLLDATIDSPPYPVTAFLDDTTVSTDGDKAKQKKTSDKFKQVFSKLAEYFRTEVSIDNNTTLHYKPIDTSAGDKGELPYEPYGAKGAPEGYKFYGDRQNGNFFLVCKGKKGDYDRDKNEYKYDFEKSLEKDQSTWVRWGWVEDNIISKYLGFASYEDEEEDGEPGGFKETKLQFRSIEDVLITDEQTGTIGTTVKTGSHLNAPNIKESVRIISHKYLLTTDINKFILVGKTPTLWKDGKDRKAQAIGNFLELNIAKLHKFEVPSQGEGDTKKREGYLRNVYFNVKFLNEKVQAARTLRQAIDNIWNEFNAEYQQYWDFKIIGNDQDLITVKLVDNNNPRYNVSDFNLSNIENNIFSCYKFPTWTKESIVKNMEYSVTIPSSQTAVAALSGGDIQVDQPADRHKGDIGVQQYQKFLQKSFTKNKNKYFKNTDRISTRVLKYGLDSANPNEKLAVATGKDMFRIMNSRGATWAFDESGNYMEYDDVKAKNEAISGIPEPSRYFTSNDTGQNLYDGGKLASTSATMEDPKKTMWELLHSAPGESKTQLFDLLNGISEIKLTIDGIAGIFPGDAFTSDHLPKHLLGKKSDEELPLVFQTTNVEQELTSNGWNTTISGMPRLNHNKIYKTVKTDKKPPEVLVDNDFKEFLDTKNILGIGYGYVTRMRMHEGIYLPLTNDKYFYIKSPAYGDHKVHDPRYEMKIKGKGTLLHPADEQRGDAEVLNKHTARSLPFPKNDRNNTMGVITTGENNTRKNAMLIDSIWPTDKSDLIFGYFTDATGGLNEKGGTLNTGHSDWHPHNINRGPSVSYQYAKNPIATFGPDVKVEEALWFSMYQGILFAIPPIKCRDKNIPYYWQNVSEDGTYKNMSYHLFKGLKKSKWNIKRKKLTENGDCEYTDEYMKEFNEENGHKGFAPCAFTGGGHDLFTYKQYIHPTMGSKGKQFNLGTYGFDKSANFWLLQIKGKKGRLKFKNFFMNMYKEFAYGKLNALNGDQIDKIKKKNIFGDEALKSVLDIGVTAWVNAEIDEFLNGMMEKGIIIIPSLLYMAIDKLGYGRATGMGDQSLQEWFFREVTDNDFNKNDPVAYSAKVKEMTEDISKNLSSGDIGFTEKFGVDGPGKITKKWLQKAKRGPFFYTENELDVEEVGANPNTLEAQARLRAISNAASGGT